MSLARRSLQVVAFIATLLVGVTSMAVIVTQTTWFKEWLRGFIVRQADDYVNGRLSIGRLDGNLFFGVELEDVDVTMNGKKVVDIKDVGLDYNVLTFLGGRVVLDDIRLNQPIVRAEKDAEGWNLARLIRARTPDPDEPKSRRPIEINEIGISDGTLYVEDQPVGTSGFAVPSRIEKLDASLGVVSNENELTVDIGHVSLRAADPEFGVNALSGVIRRTADTVTLEGVSLLTEETSLKVDGTIRNVEGTVKTIDLKATSDKLDVEEIARLVPALRGYDMQPAFEVTARGPLDRLSIDLDAREANLGKVTGDLTADVDGPERRVAGTVAMEHFNIAPLIRRDNPASRPVASDITGEGRLDLALPSGRLPLSGTYAVRAQRAVVAGYEVRDLTANGRIDGRTIRVNADAAAYGGRAQARGTVVTGTPLQLDLTGRAVNVDLRNLPPVFNAPGVPSDLQFGYTLTGRGRVFSGNVTLDSSTLAGAAIAPGTTAEFTVGAGAPAYAARGSVEKLDVQQIGRGFAIRALAEDRFRSRLNATFDLKGSGGGRYPLTLDSTGTITDSEMFGASFPRLDFTTHLAGGDAQVSAIGQFSGLDPAVITGNPRVEGKLTGAVDVNTTMRDYRQGVTVDSLDADGRVNLGQSTLAGLAIDTATIDGRYANREGELNQIAIAGPDLNVTGGGKIALNETGASNLTAHIESPALERIAEIIGRPIKGAAIVDATVTGNARELNASGTLQGSNIGYGESEALSLNTTFDVALPELTLADARVKANGTATFVEVAGENINELKADVSFSGPDSTLGFNAVATQGPRQLAAEGSAVFHPDHREIHLGNVALRAEQIEWRTTPGSSATVRYADDRIAIKNLDLVSGDQRITADGILGGAGNEALRVHAENVDVAQLDRLLLGQERLAGRLDADGTVTGSRSAPRAEGTFTLTQGAFRQFKFESLAGKVDYAGRGMNIDVRLQQTPEAWITAAGYAPTSLFRRTPEAEEGHEAPAAGEAVDLKIESSQIDLGVIQGFTSYVTNVTGALKANVHVTGSGHDPHLDGMIDIRGGTFAVPDLGTAYTGLDTRIDLKPDAVTISEMRILDEHKKALTVGGTIAVHERAVGAVDVKLQSEDFEIVDNQYADLKLDTNLSVTGALREPRVEGFVEVEAGTVEAGRIIEEVTADPYATEATGLGPRDPAPTAPAPDVPNIFDALALNVGISVPSNLVLRGTDLRPANAPIDIGDMVVTVGGLAQVQKSPGGKIRLTGEVNTVRGNYTFQGRRFEIMRDGRIRFSGTEELDPEIDLRARRVIAGVEVFVRVQGSVRQPELTFTSNPPQDQADILSLIVFNMPINELGEGQQVSLAERAGLLAGGYLASGLTRSIANALELDEFEIQAQGERGMGPSLTIGEQVGEKTYFRIRQGFGAEQATEFILEYQIADFLRLQGSVAETSGGTQRVTFRRIERAGLDLIFFFSY